MRSRSVAVAVMVVVVAAAACRKRVPAPAPAPIMPPPVAPTPVPAPVPAPSPPVTDTRPAMPGVCQPGVAWRAGAFEVVGLPCVTRDGARVLFARSDERPRYPDLTVAAVTRADQPARYVAVMEPHESAELVAAGGRATPQLDERLAQANAMLAEVAAAAVPLAPLAPTPAGTHAGQGIEIAWTEKGRLTISRDGRFVHGGDYGHWLEKLTACAPPAYLAAVWADAARGVLLVKIAYRGSGGCTALPELHVIGWTP